MVLKRNLIANFAGQGWVALVALTFLPVYVDRLGVEAYGLIGFYIVLQTWLAILDLGMTPAVTRETALISTGSRTPESIADLTHSLEIVVFSLATAFASILWLSSGLIATHWITPHILSEETVASAVGVIAFVTAARFCEGIYRGALVGLERQVFYNSVYALLSTIRYAGAAILVTYIPSINAFFWWQAGLSVVTVVVLARATYAALPRPSRRSHFSLESLRQVGGFASGMSLTAIFALLFTQADKMILSRLIDLQSFGLYMLAVALAGIFPMLAGPVASAHFPRLTAAVGAGDMAAEQHLFRSGTQIVAALAAPAIAVCFLMGREVVFAWTGDAALADAIAPILRFVAIGAFCNAALQVPFMLQLAHGWTTLSVRINLLGVVLLCPAVYLGVATHGLSGAAAAWALINVLVFVLATLAMHRHLLRDDIVIFVRDSLAIPLAASFLTVGIVLALQPPLHGRFESLAAVVASGVLALLAVAIVLPLGRRKLRYIFSSQAS